MVDVGRHRTNKLLRIHEGIDIELTAKQFVTALKVNLRTSPTDNGQGGQVTHVPQTGLQLVDVYRGHDIGLWREHVNTMTVDHDTGIDIIQETIGHEMVEVDILKTDAGTIAHLIGIIITYQLHVSTTLMGLDVCRIMCTVHFHATFCRHGRYAVVALYVTRQHGHQETDILSACLKLHVGTQALQVRHIGHKTVGIGIECGRQFNVKVLKLHKVHITLDGSLHLQRIIRPPVSHALRQVAHKAHQVLTTQLGIHTQAQLAGIDGIHQRQGHIHIHQDIAVRGLQMELRQTDTAILHHDRSAEVGYLHTALLLQCHMTHHQTYRRVVIIDGVDTDIQMGEINMIEVKTLHTGLEVLVVGQSTVQPIDTSYGIGLSAKVYQGVSGCQRTETGLHAHRIAGHVQRQIGATDDDAIHMDFP